MDPQFFNRKGHLAARIARKRSKALCSLARYSPSAQTANSFMGASDTEHEQHSDSFLVVGSHGAVPYVSVQ